jgi:hypothetical protein
MVKSDFGGGRQSPQWGPLGISQTMDRSRRPVFVMGCHRSGTNLLYDTLLSAGGFAVYRGYLPVYKMFIPVFGKLDKLENRKKMMDAWLRSKGFRRSGLVAEEIKARVLDECRTGGDFIRTIMDAIAQNQNAQRYAVYDPDNVLYVPRVKADLPEALFIHIIRDGRDIALSLKKMEGFKPLPWHREAGSLLATAMYWEWMVHKGRAYGRQIPDDYLEVLYEDLVQKPRETLATLSRFVGQELDYDQIQQTALGRISETNSSFRDEAVKREINPVQRWKERLTGQQVASIEALVGDTLEELGYALTTPAEERKPGLREKWLRTVYPAFLDAKLWLKIETPMGRLINTSVLDLADAPAEPATQA